MSHDQFLISTHNDYSGSYTDQVFVETIVKETSLDTGTSLANITHSMWYNTSNNTKRTDITPNPTVYYTFNNTLNEARSVSSSYNITRFTSSNDLANYDPGPFRGTMAYGFDGATILSASNDNPNGFYNVFNSKAKTFTIEFLMYPKSRIKEGSDNYDSNFAPLGWNGAGFKGAGSSYMRVSKSLTFTHDANSRGLFGIFSSGSSTKAGTLDEFFDFYPRSIICYGHDLIEHNTDNTVASLHGLRTTGFVYDDGDTKATNLYGGYANADAFATITGESPEHIGSVADYDSKQPQTYYLNQWQYVVITRDLTKYRVYVNGDLLREIYSPVEDTSYASNASLTFGVNPEFLWRLEAIQDYYPMFTSPSNHSKKWFPADTANGWPKLIQNIGANQTVANSKLAQQISIWGDTLTLISGTTIGYKVTSSFAYSDFLDNFCWSGSLAHWKLYQGNVLHEESIQEAYEKIFNVQYIKRKLFVGTKTLNFSENIIHDMYSKSTWTLMYKVAGQFKKVIKNDFVINNDFLTGKKDILLSSIISSVSSSFGFFGKNKNFVNLTNEEETYYDSLLPSPIDYHTENGFQPILLESGSKKSAKNLGSYRYDESVAFALPIIGKGIAQTFLNTTPAAGVQTNKINSGSGPTVLAIGDYTWPYYFPFESKYKNLKRLLKPSNDLDKTYTVKVGDSGSLSVLPWVADTSTGGGYIRMATDSVLNIPVKTNKFSGILFRLSIGLDIVGIAELNGVENTTTITITDFTLNDSIQFMQGGNLTGMVNAGVFNKKLILAPPIQETYKTYFGVGRKMDMMFHGAGVAGSTETDPDELAALRSTGSYCVDGGVSYRGLTGQVISTGFKTAATLLNGSIYGLGARVSGWKYGIVNAMPTKTNAIFRRDHFGHFRDMFEQRVYTKFSTNNNGKQTTTSSPIVVTFISGSDSYVTNSLGLDSNDSGIYHREYASGKPFID